jgi:CheY-like chemotaxis protein
MTRIVLVVDDKPLVLEVIAAMLEDMGCEVVTAATATEALEKLAADRRITILITDINMPGMSGYELAEAASRDRRGLHVIVLSGRETDGHGFPIIRKPFAQDDLRRTMQHTTGLC